MKLTYKGLWAIYFALLVVCAAAFVIVPPAYTKVFYLAPVVTAAVFAAVGLSAREKFRLQREQGLQPAWPDCFTVLAVQVLLFIFLDIAALFLPFIIALLIEFGVIVITLLVTVGEERMREAMRWLYARRKRVTAIVLAVIILVPALYFLLPYAQYRLAKAQLAGGKFENAIANFEDLDDYLNSADLLKESYYGLGRDFSDAGEYEQAYFALGDARGCEGVEAFIASVPELAALHAQYGIYNAGETVELGQWKGNPIRWNVLEQQGSRRLLYAEGNLLQKAYNDEFDIMSWEICSLRAWLNDEFISEAFDDAVRAQIPEVEIINKDCEIYRVEGGNDTVDRVFLLSTDEANHYSAVYPKWFRGQTSWLRSPGCSRIDAALLTTGGGVDEKGANIHSTRFGVRPAIWIDLAVH